MIKGIIEINTNGSKWAGQKPDPIEVWFDNIKRYRLEDFSGTSRNGNIRNFFGNFKLFSAVFNINVKVGSEADKRMLTMMKTNRRMIKV